MTVRCQQLINNSSAYFKMLKVYLLMTRCRCTYKLGCYCDCAMPTFDKQFKYSACFKMLKVYLLMTRCQCTYKLGGYCDCAMPTVDKQFKCMLKNVKSIFTDDTMSVYT